MSIPDAKLGWMAGILDYHGLLIRKKNRTRATPQLVLMVESTKVSVVRELGRLTGSHAESRHNRLVKDWMQRGCTEHCPEPHIEHEAPGPSFLPPVTRWTVTGAAMAIVLHNVIPHMVTDRGMEAAMEEALANVVTSGHGVGAVRASVKRMEELDWVIPGELSSISAPVSEAAARRHRKETA